MTYLSPNAKQSIDYIAPEFEREFCSMSRNLESISICKWIKALRMQSLREGTQREEPGPRPQLWGTQQPTERGDEQPAGPRAIRIHGHTNNTRSFTYSFCTSHIRFMGSKVLLNSQSLRQCLRHILNKKAGRKQLIFCRTVHTCCHN